MATPETRPMTDSNEIQFLAYVVYVDVDHFQPPSHVLQELGPCSSSSTNPQLGMQIVMQQSETCRAEALQWRKFSSHAVWNVMKKLVPALQRIQDTKFKQECAIKLVNIACKQTKWIQTFDNDPDFATIMITLETAITSGIIEFLSIYMEFFPLPVHHPIYKYLLSTAIQNRQHRVFNFLHRRYPESGVNFYTDAEQVSTLHMVAKFTYCPKITSIAGAAFQLQKELQWFKGIEKLISPYFTRRKNVNWQTPWELFKKEHGTMHKEAEKWMKNTAQSCMLVATLIATVVFAAAFTVPGGNSQDTGTPIFLQKNTFMLFAAFDALALFSSINSLWMFLSILTARFAMEDFLRTLPKRLIFGLASLFLAIVSAIITFGVALSLVLGHRQNEVIILIVLMAFISIAMFAILQLPLFIEMVQSTCGRELLGS